MAKFIRIDEKDNWRGKEHVSSLNGLAEESVFEEGISCYSLNDVAEGVDNLRQYWMDIAMFKVSDFQDMQVTIFEGEKVGQGSDYEDLATCERTLLELDALSFMEKVYTVFEQYEDDDISEDKYHEALEKIL